MKLRNKKTGEIVEAESCNSYTGTIGLFFEKGRETDRAYETLAKLNEEWEDVEDTNVTKSKERMKHSEKLKEVLDEIHKLAEESVLYLPKLESLDLEEEKEPLIKNEKVRKVIRAWADVNDITRVVYYSPENELTDSFRNTISFNLMLSELRNSAEYTITELCGEEEK